MLTSLLQGVISWQYYGNPILLHCLDSILSGLTCNLKILDHLPEHLKWPDDRVGHSTYIYIDSLVSLYDFHFLIEFNLKIIPGIPPVSALPNWEQTSRLF